MEGLHRGRGLPSTTRSNGTTLMRVAVLSLTRDRLEYTQHCFEKLREYAGCDFDHYILDQASTAVRQAGLWGKNSPEPNFRWAQCVMENIGIHAGMNALIDRLHQRESAGGIEYDVIVKFDNDCELTQ